MKRREFIKDPMNEVKIEEGRGKKPMIPMQMSIKLREYVFNLKYRKYIIIYCGNHCKLESKCEKLNYSCSDSLIQENVQSESLDRPILIASVWH